MPVNISRRTFSAGLCASTIGLSSVLNASETRAKNFKVFGALLHAGEPDLRPYGIDPIYLFDRGIWREGASRFDPPDPQLVQERLESLPDDGAPIVMDFEFFQLRTREEAARSREGLLRIAKTFGRFAGDRPIGFYEYLPRRNYWDSIRPSDHPDRKQWQELNSFMAPLERAVDVLHPSLYTFRNNPRRWQKYARAQIREARRISDKPVIPFIWPDFHYNGEDGPLEPLPRKFWRLQLDTLAEIADGIVIWGGWDPVARARVRWDDNAPWWLETQEFLQQLG